MLKVNKNYRGWSLDDVMMTLARNFSPVYTSIGKCDGRLKRGLDGDTRKYCSKINVAQFERSKFYPKLFGVNSFSK